jgi:hypothetical protein
VTIEGFEDPMNAHEARQADILDEIVQERIHQDKKWGGPDHDDKHGPYAWVSFITTYLGQAISDIVNEKGSYEVNLRTFRYHMVKVAALAVAAVEMVDRKLGSPFEND